MQDIFLSYSRPDRARAQLFAEGFEREGFTVWWDQALRAGEEYDKVTELALDKAKAVVVLWSPRSVDSRWVRAEATQADRKGVLLPVMIEQCRRPIMFELVHTADLSSWRGDASDSTWRAFLADVRALAGSGHHVNAASSTSALASTSKRRWLMTIAGALVAISLAVLAGYLLRPSLAPSPSLNPHVTPASARHAAETDLPLDDRAFQECPTCPSMVAIPGDAFTMGSSTTEPGHQKDEEPTRRVLIASFAIAKTETTIEQFAAFVRDTKRAILPGCTAFRDGTWVADSSLSWQNPGFKQQLSEPVLCVTAADAADYTAWLSRKTGARYRLPSEAEWEYSARAGSISAFYWGDSLSDACSHASGVDISTGEKYPNFEKFVNCRDGYINTAPVGTFSPNDFGLYDTAGNVWERVADCYTENLGGVPENGAPLFISGCQNFVVRGGAWHVNHDDLRSARRNHTSKPYRGDGIGFRVARDL